MLCSNGSALANQRRLFQVFCICWFPSNVAESTAVFKIPILGVVSCEPSKAYTIIVPSNDNGVEFNCYFRVLPYKSNVFCWLILQKLTCANHVWYCMFDKIRMQFSLAKWSAQLNQLKMESPLKSVMRQNLLEKKQASPKIQLPSKCNYSFFVAKKYCIDSLAFYPDERGWFWWVTWRNSERSASVALTVKFAFRLLVLQSSLSVYLSSLHCPWYHFQFLSCKDWLKHPQIRSTDKIYPCTRNGQLRKIKSFYCC